MLFRKTTLATLIIAGSAFGLSPIAVQAAAPVAFTSSHPFALYIRDIDVDQVQRVRPGAELDFSVRGTPDSQVTLQIDGGARAISLHEASPGIYEGTYTVSRSDRIGPNSRVSVTMRRGDQVASAQLAQGLQQGWPAPSVAVITGPEITHLNVADEGFRRGGQMLRFTLQGTPGGRASVQLEGSDPQTLILDEVRPGQYTAIYTLRRHTVLNTDRPLIAQLRHGQRVATSTLSNAYAGLDLRSRFAACGVDCGVVESVSRLERGPWREPQFEVVVRTNEGSRRVVTYNDSPPVRVGDAVRFAGDGLELRGRG
ncbi:hypothetical protein HLB44_00970 [Aquincola sp. S2]|uniref:Uncharacterized protein n=1 Tax=Pseudaquabacterium terrae TaxID=2732868 RepID=A0ABX2E995_9BURK|nr:hypothetical protein [Aquabacterium terrae]NRF65544.1 hypothetical protein [Aquabacterium terrae]